MVMLGKGESSMRHEFLFSCFIVFLCWVKGKKRTGEQISPGIHKYMPFVERGLVDLCSVKCDGVIEDDYYGSEH